MRSRLCGLLLEFFNQLPHGERTALRAARHRLTFAKLLLNLAALGHVETVPFAIVASFHVRLLPFFHDQVICIPDSESSGAGFEPLEDLGDLGMEILDGRNPIRTQFPSYCCDLNNVSKAVRCAGTKSPTTFVRVSRSNCFSADGSGVPWDSRA